MKEEINKELKNKKAKVESVETRVQEGKEINYVTIIGTAKKIVHIAINTHQVFTMF